jgi:signal transduction histidine kinase
MRRAVSLLTAFLLVMLGIWAVSLLDWAPWGGAVAANVEASTLTASADRGLARVPAALLALVSLTGAVGVAGLMLTATQRGWADGALSAAGMLWAVQACLTGRREFGAAVLAPAWLSSVILAGAVVLTAWYGLWLIQRPTRSRRRLPLVRAVLLGSVATGLLAVLGWLDAPALQWLVPLCGTVLGAGVVAHAVDLARRRGVGASRHSAGAWVLVATGALALGCAVHELSLRAVWPAGSEARANAWYATHGALLLLLSAMLLLRLAQLARMLRQLGRSHRAWRARLRDAQRDQHDLRDRLILRERTESQYKQRDRILRELHDELGHRLIGLQDQSGRTEADCMRTRQVIDTSLLELRMAYDALEPVPRPLNDALLTLREQLQPALAQAGVRLHWALDARAAMLVLPPAQTLQLLRIVREALDLSQPHSSVVQQSNEAQFAMQVLDGETGRHLRLRISEGAAKAGPATRAPQRLVGPAWVKLQRQATMLGAQLVVESHGLGAQGGCALELVMPLGAAR